MLTPMVSRAVKIISPTTQPRGVVNLTRANLYCLKNIFNSVNQNHVSNLLRKLYYRKGSP